MYTRLYTDLLVKLDNTIMSFCKIDNALMITFNLEKYVFIARYTYTYKWKMERILNDEKKSQIQSIV